MDIDEAIAGRRSVREFTNKVVDEKVVMQIIISATRAPSAMNEQPCSFTVVSNQRMLDHASEAAKAYMLASTPLGAQPPHFKAMLDDPSVQIFHHAPVLVLISAAKEGAFNVEDCALAAENLMLAGFAAGLGSCWIGMAQNYFQTPEGKAAFGIPDAWTPIAPIILGHPKTANAAVTRNAPEILWIG